MKTKVVHSETKSAWNIVSTEIGSKYKIARVPYVITGCSQEIDGRNRKEALDHAQFISKCLLDYKP